MKRRSGFTLVEMAVVIVIVLILAALLIPVFRRANKSYGSCSSNLKQVGIVFMQYAQDSGEQYPRVVMHDVSQSLPPYSKPFGWADALQPYVKTTNVLQCPTVENTDYIVFNEL